LRHKNRYTFETISMSERSKKNILFIFMVLAFTAAVAGYLLWNKPHRNIKNANAIETNANALYNIFIAGSAKAKSTYLNKIVIVSGIVKEVTVNQQHQQIILLKTSVADASVNCTMEESTNSCKAGEAIRLKGICVGFIGGEADMGLPGDVFLIRCYPSI
jgi:hypothetical protein